MRTRRIVLVTLAVAWVAGSAAAARSPSLTAGDPPLARPVRLEVFAVDSGGRLVDGLTAADFEVVEEGALQTVEEARFIRADQPGASEPAKAIESDADERAEAARPDARLVAIFLDEYHVTAGNSARVRAALTRFVDQYLAPQDLLVIMRPLDSLFTIRLTRDRARIRETIEAFNGRQGDYTARNSYEQNYLAGTPARVELLRAQVSTSALNALAVHIGTLTNDARKTLIVVSEGLPRVDRRRGLEALPTLDTLSRSASRYNVAVYPVDPREAPASAPPADDDPLRVLAIATSGQPIANVSDLVDGMRPIASDSGAYYLLRYTTTEAADGKFHSVQVRVTRPGISVRTRKGYWAVPSDDAVRAALLRPRTPAVVEPPRRISPLIRPWFGVTRGSNGRTRVTFVWEPAGRVPGTKQQAAARVVLKVLAADGAAIFDDVVLPTGPLRPDTFEEPRARAEFEAPPGSLRLRMSIQDAAEQAIDTDVREITVRDLSAAMAIGTPSVFRGRNARDFRALAAAADAVPVSSREFSRTERLLIRVPVYPPANAEVTMTARLLNRKGQTLRNLPVRPVAGLTAVSEIDLALASFASGDYRIEIVARTPAAEAKDGFDLRVTN